MIDKAKLKVLKKFLEIAYPERDINVEKIGKHFIMTQGDHVGCRDFILEGQYTYDQVMKLNKMTGYSVGFGFCKELGPIAFIGVPNPRCVQASGYFDYDIQEYGDSFKEGQYYFEQYSDEDAKKIGNYTVYGMGDPRIFENTVPVKKLNYFKDYRYQRKDEFKEGFNSDILEMEIKLGGTYGFYEARKFAYGSTGEFTGASGEDVPIQFAIVGNNQPVGILGLWKHYDNSMFRDVWGSNEDEPETQPIRFISDDEAKKINQFKLYYFIPTHSFGRKQFVVEKKDRMFDRSFNFTMSDGTDYRLQEFQRKQDKIKTLTNQSNNNQ